MPLALEHQQSQAGEAPVGAVNGPDGLPDRGRHQAMVGRFIATVRAVSVAAAMPGGCWLPKPPLAVQFRFRERALLRFRGSADFRRCAVSGCQNRQSACGFISVGVRFYDSAD
ncbi:MAG: hypothetical protein OXI70_15000, partial [Chloroflexota bacterium]|nr:hypothetical protein [Chloroflexota bacterium]